MIVLGILSYPVGRVIAWFDPNPDRFPFKEFSWEHGGKIYEKLDIKGWQARIPDVSKVLRKGMPSKSLKGGSYTSDSLHIMIRETCVAESVHDILSICGLHLMGLWDGIGGVIIFLVYVLLGNLPFILVQRYNRPRLKKMRDILLKKEARQAEKSLPLPAELPAEEEGC